MIVADVAAGATVRNGFHDPAYLAATGVVHEGADLAVAVGTPVRTPVAGSVVFAGWDDASGDGGNGVKVRAIDGTEVGVWHLAQATAAVGQAVVVGALLGYSGQTGNAAYGHVHLQVERPRGTPIDPVAYLGGLGGGAPIAPVGVGGGGGVRWGPVAAVGALALVALAVLDDD